MRIFDAHCDTISKILDENKELFDNDCHLSIKKMQKGDISLQFFAAWIEPKYIDKKNFEKQFKEFPQYTSRIPSEFGAYKRAKSILDKFYTEYEKNREYLQLVTTVDDLNSIDKTKKIGALLTIEGGETIEGNLDHLEQFFELGVRGMTLTWNNENEIAFGSGCENSKGLKPFGKQVVKKMNKLGMFIDVSHINEKGFWDVIELTDTPIIATHSNSFKICNHVRNLTDEQIRALIKTNGFIGINFYPDFLCSGLAGSSDILKHIEHMLSLGGENIIGFGADFDGIDKQPQGFTDCSIFSYIVDHMFKLGYSEELIQRITHKNLKIYLSKILSCA